MPSPLIGLSGSKRSLAFCTSLPTKSSFGRVYTINQLHQNHCADSLRVAVAALHF